MTKTALIFALTLVGASIAVAQTPDGQPPSIEDPCKFEKGAAYGLCNAYCAAMDCSSANPAASPAACQKVRNKYTQLTGNEIPCELPCICLVIPGFAEATEGPGIACVERPRFGTVFLFTANGFTASTLTGNAAPSDGGCGLFTDIENPTAMNTHPEDGAKCNAYLLSIAADLGLTCSIDPT
jgi:hypothetical protein